MDVGSSSYRITDELANKMKLKSVLLFAETITLTLFYLISMDKFRDIPFKDAESDVIFEGLSYTLIFLFLMISAFFITSVLIVPLDVGSHMEELDEYEKHEVMSKKLN